MPGESHKVKDNHDTRKVKGQYFNPICGESEQMEQAKWRPRE